MGWIGVDLDRTLAHYDGGKGELHIGAPIPKMQARVKSWLAEGQEVRIFTARASRQYNLDGTECNIHEIILAIQNWTLEHLGQRLPVTNEKDYACIKIFDDIAVQVIPNTGEFVGGD